ncbi:hypothetical protein FJ955_02985 [Mesorhizobium sp. B2-2-2]|uniref:hypothetical protein n=1 Tax=Mesorhizobium sp. B2-2-2 TaxID=2589964 RepID=UPI00112D05F4|nr:hypothetical protein [Mesorhizobium sp. B2-2-2]TPM33721.1 hypothetical protein FJ955_02985 [Mesorhizobium sp. B2-2-2]
MTANNAFDDGDLSEEDIRQMAERLLGGWRPASALTGLDPVELRMAQKLLGRSNAERLAHKGRGQRFKYRRPNHIIEYYRTGWGWTVDLLENGMRQTFKACLDDQQIGTVLAAIKARNIPVRLFETEGQKLERQERERRLETSPTIKVRPKSERFDILFELKDFRP